MLDRIPVYITGCGSPAEIMGGRDKCREPWLYREHSVLADTWHFSERWEEGQMEQCEKETWCSRDEGGYEYGCNVLWHGTGQDQAVVTCLPDYFPMSNSCWRILAGKEKICVLETSSQHSVEPGRQEGKNDQSWETQAGFVDHDSFLLSPRVRAGCKVWLTLYTESWLLNFKI